MNPRDPKAWIRDSKIWIATLLGFALGAIAGAFALAGDVYFVLLSLAIGGAFFFVGLLAGLWHVAEKVPWPPPRDWGNRSW